MIPAATLVLLTAAFVNASLRAGGMNSVGWSLSLSLIASAGLVFWLGSPRSDLSPRLPGRFRLAFSLLLGLLILQILPLPIGIIRIVSVVDARALDPLVKFLPGAWFGTLSLAPFSSFLATVNLLAFAVVLLLMREIAWRLHEHVWIAATPLLLMALGQATYGLVQYAADPSHGVAAGTFLNRDHFAAFLEMCLPFAIFHVWTLIAGHRSNGQPVSILSAIKISGMFFVVAAILLAELRSLSRLAPLSTLISFALVIWLLLRLRRSGLSLLLRFGSAVALAAFVIILLIPERTFVRFAGAWDDDGVYDVRQLIWRDTGRMIADHPAAGVGFGAFAYGFPFYQQELPNSRVRYAHNDYLQWLAELGVPGGIVLITLLTFFFAIAVRASVVAMASDAQPRSHLFPLACTAGMAALMLHSFGDYNFYVPVNAMTFAWITGMAAGTDPSIHLQRLLPAIAASSAIAIEDGRAIDVTIIHPGTPSQPRLGGTSRL
jgi:O-antigen ligase